MKKLQTTKTIEQSTFRGWEVYEVLPDGWKIDYSCGSTVHGSPLYPYVFCTNGKSILNGGKRALVRMFCEVSRETNSL